MTILPYLGWAVAALLLAGILGRRLGHWWRDRRMAAIQEKYVDRALIDREATATPA